MSLERLDYDNMTNLYSLGKGFQFHEPIIFLAGLNQNLHIFEKACVYRIMTPNIKIC